MQKGILDKLTLGLLIVVLVIEGVGAFRPLPKPRTFNTSYTIPAVSLSLPWPATGQSAIGAVGYGVLASSGKQSPTPIASVAKVITALAVLKQKPLDPDQEGPIITLGQADVDSYQSFVSQDGSVVPVADGEQLSERQALEAMLLPSANNMAYSLANWAFGSLTDYTTYANNFVKSLGLNDTTMADASGFSPQTVSTANDLTVLAQAALKNPTLTSIVGEASASIPVAGTVINTNWLLGSDGVIGIKTGNTDQAGGCFMFAAKHEVQGQSLSIVGTVLNEATLAQAMTDARSMLSSVDSNFQLIKIADAGQQSGSYQAPWGNSVSLVTKDELSMLVWRGQKLSVKTSLHFPAVGSAAGTSAGIINAVSGTQKASVAVVSKQALPKPSLSWRLAHP